MIKTNETDILKIQNKYRQSNEIVNSAFSLTLLLLGCLK